MRRWYSNFTIIVVVFVFCQLFLYPLFSRANNLSDFRIPIQENIGVETGIMLKPPPTDAKYFEEQSKIANGEVLTFTPSSIAKYNHDLVIISPTGLCGFKQTNIDIVGIHKFRITCGQDLH
jgi:hypothetical protein